MTGPDWLSDTRTSYDTVATAYADLLRGHLAGAPYDRAVLALFAELVGPGGPVLDAGCGPGRITAHLQALGLAPAGVDLSPGMVDVARRDHPGLRFEVGSMTDLAVPDASLAGVLAWYSLIHVPDEVVPVVLAGFRRVLRPGGVALLAFQVGDEHRVKTSGYGDLPMSLPVHLRPPERVESWLADAGLPVQSRLVREAAADEHVPQAYLIAHRPS
ncbi:methyltransferase domain-containing protein [Modestobacter sp. I12A-02628]|uniref:Class I SAM-dependent methyltransferase n=1 Tax=Goekera deserti TaxID=2497753 RepID=A0A7K3WHV7_9ACTN|nr:class I SAM-dependent methyltransferase [Goekera deserti]MPQ99091.1 methyltransferase domain-containing protein [Goekera deserti]NDI47425.1 methyltransferase domain-containing protein [Goekera deserti]NEL55956.1 class I SAM-dependent methyltransferase [Goekera deserti]